MKALSTLKAIAKFNWPYVKPKSCEITLHYLCNAKCVFCYNDIKIPDTSLDLKKTVAHINRSFKNGSRLCQIIGGEPTLYPHLEKVISIARKIGYPVIQIVTNGLVLSDIRKMELLKKAGLNSITFSIHSFRKSVHDRVVGISGAFEKIEKSVENAIKLEIHITVGTAVTSINYRDIPGLVKYFNQKYQIESFHIIALHMIGHADREKAKLKISYKHTIPYIKKAVEYLQSCNAFPLSQILSNYTPCLLPGYEDLISDWKIPFSDDDLILPEKSYYDSMYTMITENLRTKTRKCKKCIYYRICAGFEKKYYEEFGDDEFVPLNKIHKPIQLSCFYKK